MTCHLCDHPAVARLVLLSETDDPGVSTEAWRTPAKCRWHYLTALNLWDRLRVTAPDATAGLILTVTGP